MTYLIAAAHTAVLVLADRLTTHRPAAQDAAGTCDRYARRDRGASTLEIVFWAVGLLALAGVVYAAVQSYVNSKLPNPVNPLPMWPPGTRSAPQQSCADPAAAAASPCPYNYPDGNEAPPALRAPAGRTATNRSPTRKRRGRCRRGPARRGTARTCPTRGRVHRSVRHHVTSQRSQAGETVRRDRGVATVQLVVLMPVLFALLFAGMQAALIYHARSVAIAAAQQGARAAAAQLGSAADGEQAATAFVASAGGRDVLAAPRVSATRTATTVTVRVDGTALSVIPGWLPTITQTATLPVDRVTG